MSHPSRKTRTRGPAPPPNPGPTADDYLDAFLTLLPPRVIQRIAGAPASSKGIESSIPSPSSTPAPSKRDPSSSAVYMRSATPTKKRVPDPS